MIINKMHCRVEKGSKAAEVGLRRGDQILEVNGQSFERASTARQAKVLDVLRGVCHLSITVKSNLLAFNEVMHVGNSDNGGNMSRARGKSAGALVDQDVLMPPSVSAAALNEAYSGSEGTLASMSSLSGSNQERKRPPAGPTLSGGGGGGSSRSRINRAFKNLLHKPKSLVSVDQEDGGSSNGGQNYLHHNATSSNPDLTRDPHNLEGGSSSNGGNSSTRHLKPSSSEFPEHVLKVYRADQTFKYLLVHKETTAREVVMLALHEFGMAATSAQHSDGTAAFALCEVSVSDGGFVKQRRLPDAMQNLAERIGLASRYYIKCVSSSGGSDSSQLLPDEHIGDLAKEAQVHLLQLNPVELSTQLMVEDFTIFRQIEATEYVDDLFELTSTDNSGYGTPCLSLFSELVNREMMWTVTEVVAESNVNKRMRIVKQYIKVARQCRETQNFNSMFAIISGLGHGAVSRLVL